MKLRFVPALVLTASLLYPVAAHASLTTFQTLVGTYGVSTDGFGSLAQTGTISASVPLGATVVGAWLYSSNFGGPIVPGGTLGGSAVAYGPAVPNNQVCCGLSSNRADVTAIVAPIIDGGPGGVYDFTVTETDGNQDGTALVVVYSLASLPVSTVGILDGFSAAGGDSTAINFADPLDPTAAEFFAEMRIASGFSCCSQRSEITVNGTLITENAGNNDDGTAVSNGSLFTMGGFDDPFSPMLPAYDEDHERYNLIPQIVNGSTSILVETNNPSNDDNIFLAVFHVLGEAGFVDDPTAVPEPGTLSLLAIGGAAALRKVRRRRKAA